MNAVKTSLADLNALSRERFVQTIGPVFEHSQWVAEKTWTGKSFASLADLHQVLCQTVANSSREQKLELIKAHPDLAGRAALAGNMTTTSQNEQASAGLNQLGPKEAELFQNYNRQYWDKFGFPFVICARLNKKEAILAGFQRRLGNDREKEIETALAEIYKIAELRLCELILMPAKLTTHVLDTANGRPARNLQVELWAISGNERKLLKTARTNSDGRLPLLEDAEMQIGEFELVFFVGDYFAEINPQASGARFLDRVPVRFSVTERASYHIPLLCSPWAYSTYRGS